MNPFSRTLLSLRQARQSIPMEGDTLIIFRPLIFGTIAFGPGEVRLGPIVMQNNDVASDVKDHESNFLPDDVLECV